MMTYRLLGLWLLLVIVSLFSRHFVPVDETRYVTVAWNMWLRDDFLVPWLNGSAYSHKPPLLFWLMHAGWTIFGVNDWWPRLVPSLSALASLFLSMRLARQLWPQQTQIAETAPLILLTSALWMVFSTATMFDMLVASCTLLGMLGILTAWQGDAFKGWLMVAVAIGLGLLAKGPVILLHILPVAVLAPWWGRASAKPAGRWFFALLISILVGVAIVLAWAIPAGIRGGASYQHEIFWGQTADRMIRSFAHRQPVWWYLPLLPVILFPWLLWLPTWRGLAKLRDALDDTGVRFCLVWMVPTFVGFSLISGKQVHYLLPIFPAFALLVARGLLQISNCRFDRYAIAVSTLIIGAGLSYMPYYAHNHYIASWVGHIPVAYGIAIMLSAVIMIIYKYRQWVSEIWTISLFSIFTVILTVNFVIIDSAHPAFDMRAVASRIKVLQDQEVPLVHVGSYVGQYQFVGRLSHELEVVYPNQLARWFKAHPAGKAVIYFRTRQFGLMKDVKFDYQQPYRGINVVILGEQAWLHASELIQNSTAE